MLFALLCILAVTPGIMATLIEHVSGPLRLAERHHSHHDTYVVSPDYTRSLVVAMLIVGFMGALLALFCVIGVFASPWAPVLAFTDAFVLTMLVLWLLLSRYKVSLFEDRGVITPLLWRDECFFYQEIQAMDWTGLHRNSGYRDLRIRVADGRSIRVWGLVDIEQVLLHVDRFDVLAPLPTENNPLRETLAQRKGSWQPLMREARPEAPAAGEAAAAQNPQAPSAQAAAAQAQSPQATAAQEQPTIPGGNRD